MKVIFNRENLKGMKEAFLKTKNKNLPLTDLTREKPMKTFLSRKSNLYKIEARGLVCLGTEKPPT